jgi:hypothetical protein
MSWIVISVGFAFALAVAFALYTRRGSGINPRHDPEKTLETEKSAEFDPQQPGDVNPFDEHGPR